jgi:hypothetical protein
VRKNNTKNTPALPKAGGYVLFTIRLLTAPETLETSKAQMAVRIPETFAAIKPRHGLKRF